MYVLESNHSEIELQADTIDRAIVQAYDLILCETEHHKPAKDHVNPYWEWFIVRDIHGFESYRGWVSPPNHERPYAVCGLDPLNPTNPIREIDHPLYRIALVAAG